MSERSGAPDRAAWQGDSLALERAAARVRPHLPAALTEGLEPAGAGDFCFAFRAGGWIVRVARHAEAAEAIRRESCMLGRIADRLSLAVPRLEHHAPEGCPPFTVHREVTGAVLTRAAWSRLSSGARARVAGQLAEFLHGLHDLAREAGGCGLGELDPVSRAERLRRAAGSQLVGLLSPETAGRVDAFLAARATDRGAGRPLALLHADLSPGHLLYDPTSEALTGVIDFGDVVLGPPARDFIYVYEDFGVDRCREVVEAYAPEDTPALMEEVRAWYLLEALSWTLERLRAGARADVGHGIREISRELSA